MCKSEEGSRCAQLWQGWPANESRMNTDFYQPVVPNLDSVSKWDALVSVYQVLKEMEEQVLTSSHTS